MIEKKEKESTGNQSLIRGLTLLELLAQFPNGCPLAHLAELSGLNKSTVHRLLQGLLQEGYVRPAPNFRQLSSHDKMLGYWAESVKFN